MLVIYISDSAPDSSPTGTAVLPPTGRTSIDMAHYTFKAPGSPPAVAANTAETYSAQEAMAIQHRGWQRRGPTNQEMEIMSRKLREEAEARGPVELTVVGVSILLLCAPPIVI